ncbi:MAG: prepilin peptidase [Alphaproteobacteria bacterium]|nr:prepilin peptidase [Alphaproteobacteria bacterium]
MTLPSILFYFCIIQFIGLCLAAALNDIKYFKIPNTLVLFGGLLFIPTAFISLSADMVIDHLILAGIVLVVCFIVFAFGIFGAGDAKFLSVAALWSGPEFFPLLLIVMALVGGVMASVQFLRSRYEIKFNLGMLDIRRLEEIQNLKLPYGVAIATGAVSAAILQVISVYQNPLPGIGG